MPQPQTTVRNNAGDLVVRRPMAEPSAEELPPNMPPHRAAEWRGGAAPRRRSHRGGGRGAGWRWGGDGVGDDGRPASRRCVDERRRIRRYGVRFTVITPEYAVGGQGAGSFILNAGDARPQQLVFGPTLGNGASLYPLTCEKASCQLGVYEDFTQPKDVTQPNRWWTAHRGRDRPARRETALPRRQQGDRGDRRDPGPLTKLRFSATAGAEESWDIQIDNLVVT